MGIKKDRHSLRGSSPLEIILILMSVGLLIFLVMPIYNSFKAYGLGLSNDSNGGKGNSPEAQTPSSLSPAWNLGGGDDGNGSVEVKPVILPPLSEE